jgi:hypothetical protein
MRCTVRVLLGVLLLILPLAGTAFAQDSDEALKKEIEALKVGQQQIRKDLQEIKKLLQARPAAPPPPSGPSVEGKTFDIGSNPVKGEATAKLTLIEFTDYQ